MSSSGLLCLKWNNHTTAFDKLLNNLHLRDMYSDGTIVCHGKFYPVHRFVLSTCSEYFEEIFRQSINLKSKHPFIIVKDIQPPQMEALLNYMYRGEVNVPQEVLPELIKAAEAFKIKGLAVPDDEPAPSKNSSSRERKRLSTNLSSPCSQVKKSKRADYSSKSDIMNSKRDCDIRHCEELQTECSDVTLKNYSSSSSQKEANELFIPEILPNEVKSEPADLTECNETEEISNHSAPPEEKYLSPKELGIKDEKSFDSYATAEPFPPYEGDDIVPSDDQYDLTQSSSWENSENFEGDNNLEEHDSSEGIGTNASTTPSSSTFTSIHSDGNDPTSNYGIPTNSKSKLSLCPYCSYQSFRKERMTTHIRKHTGEKPFQCTHCSFKCSQKSNLQTHMVMHAEEKRFYCPHCNYSANHKICLTLHLKKHGSNT